MRRLYFLSFLFLLSCFNEDGVDVGNANTYIKYFNGGGDDVAVAFAETEDKGFIILANTSLNGGRIKLVKTDLQGNRTWSKLFPESTTSSVTYRGFGLEVLPGNAGYVIAGDYIDNSPTNPTPTYKLMIMVISTEGNKTQEKIYDYTLGLQGKAIVAKKDASNNVLSYVVLSNIVSGGGNENMALSEVSKTDLSPVWMRTYGAGQANLTNKLFIDANGKILWGGTVVRESETDMRFVRTEQDRQNTDFDLPIGSPDYNETGNDICRYGFGYAMIGSTNKSSTGSLDILFKRLSEDGTEIKVNTDTFPVKNSNGTEVPGDKIGNALTVTQDGGLLLVGTVPSDASLFFGRGETDLYLIKINAFGETVWEKPLGSRNADVGVAALQASDGGYMILATATFAGLKTIMLIKTDTNGNIK
jgi:hypothetical protein